MAYRQLIILWYGLSPVNHFCRVKVETMSNKIWNNFELPKDVGKNNITVPSRVPDENYVSVSPSSVSRSNKEAPVYDMIHKIIKTLTNGLVITFDNKSYGLYEMHTPTKKGGRTRKHHNKKRNTRKH